MGLLFSTCPALLSACTCFLQNLQESKSLISFILGTMNSYKYQQHIKQSDVTDLHEAVLNLNHTQNKSSTTTMSRHYLMFSAVDYMNHTNLSHNECAELHNECAQQHQTFPKSWLQILYHTQQLSHKHTETSSKHSQLAANQRLVFE